METQCVFCDAETDILDMQITSSLRVKMETWFLRDQIIRCHSPGDQDTECSRITIYRVSNVPRITGNHRICSKLVCVSEDIAEQVGVHTSATGLLCQVSMSPVRQETSGTLYTDLPSLMKGNVYAPFVARNMILSSPVSLFALFCYTEAAERSSMG